MIPRCQRVGCLEFCHPRINTGRWGPGYTKYCSERCKVKHWQREWEIKTWYRNFYGTDYQRRKTEWAEHVKVWEATHETYWPGLEPGADTEVL